MPESIHDVLPPRALSQSAEAFIEESFQFQEIMMMYSSAIREVRTKLEILNDDLTMRNRRNPIEFITHRVKNRFQLSINCGKMVGKFLPPLWWNI